MAKRIGVLTSGGDAPGMNAAVRSVARAALNKGMEVVGIRRGYNGLLNGDYIEMPIGNYSKSELEKTRYRVITNEVGNSSGTEKTYLNYIFEF